MKKMMIVVVFTLTLTSLFAFESFNEAMKAGDAAKKEKKHADAAAAYKAGYEKAMNTDQKFAAGERYARALYNNGRRADAVRIGKEVMELKDLSAGRKQNATYMYAWFLQQNKQNAESEAVLAEALKTDRYFEFYDIYVNCLLNQKKFEEAGNALSEMEKAAKNKTEQDRVAQKKVLAEKTISGK